MLKHWDIGHLLMDNYYYGEAICHSILLRRHFNAAQETHTNAKALEYVPFAQESLNYGECHISFYNIAPTF